MIKQKRIKEFKNDRMSDSTYLVRRQVIDIIYQAKKITNLPRIDVRVGKARDNTLGLARLNDNIIWIDVEKCTDKLLLQVVLHEICHAVYGTPHDNDCKLMNPVARQITEKQAWTIFKTYTI